MFDESLKFNEVVDRYIKYVLLPRENNQKREIQYMEQWKGYILNKPLKDIKKSVIAEAREVMFDDKQGNSRGTGKVAVNRAMARLSHFFNVCVEEWELLNVNPCTGIKPFKESKGKLDYLLLAQIYALLAECSKSKNKDMYLFALMVLTSGGRKSEILNLEFETINYETNSAKLAKQKNGHPGGELYIGAEAIALIKAKRRTTGKIFIHKYIDKGFKMAAKRAGVERISPHGLRHTFASHFSMSGASTQEVQEVLRVSSVKMVNRYAHLTKDHVRDKINSVTNKWSILP